MRNPSARAVEAAATEEILLRLATEVDKRFQDVATELRATNGAVSALGGEMQGHVEKTASQMKVLQEDNKNLKVYIPGKEEKDQELEVDNSAYEMLHRLNVDLSILRH